MVSGIEFVNRIDEKIKNKYKTRKEFCDELNLTPATVSTWKSRNIMPPVETIVRIAEKLNVSIDWLVKGNNKIVSDNENYNRGFADGVNFVKEKVKLLNIE